MKIAIISFTYVEHCAHLAKALSKRNDVLLMLPKKEKVDNAKILSKFFSDSNVKLHLFDKFPNYDLRNLLTVKSIKEEVGKFGPNVICLQSLYYWLYFILDFLKTYPLVTQVHDPIFHSGTGSTKYKNINSYLQKLIIKNSDQIIVNGKKLALGFSKKYNYPLDKIHTMLFSEYSLTKDISQSENKVKLNRILFFGRVHYYKGIDILVSTEKYLASFLNDFKICIAGSGNHELYRNKIIDTENYDIISEKIEWTDISSIFQEADIVVLPYRDATQSGVIANCLAYRKPIIVTNRGSIDEIVKHNKSALILEKLNSITLAANIITLLNDDKLKRKFSKNIDISLKTHLSWDNVIKPVEKAFANAIKLHHSTKN